MAPSALGCMRLSTAVERDEVRGVEVIVAALQAGVRLLDTADAYAHDTRDTGHNERLVARALAAWGGDRAAVTVVTKGGLTRPGGRWVPDGRAAHLRRACEASREALGGAPIDLYLLHASDPNTALATSVRALASLREQGLVRRIGLCNVTVAQIEQARRITPLDAVQVAMGLSDARSFHTGVAEHCLEHGLLLLAHSPFGGPARAAKVGRSHALRRIAERYGTSPQVIALVWLRELLPGVVPLPGATRPETAAALGRVLDLTLDDEERAAIDAEQPDAARLRVPRARRRPPDDAGGEVVLLMGIPGAGKSRLAARYVDQGYRRLNRDDLGGRLAGLLPALGEGLARGQRRWVLDNTYAHRPDRNRVIEVAWAHGVPVRCVWLDTPLPDAQINAVERLVRRCGELPSPERVAALARDEPGLFLPQVQLRYARDLEPPAPDEGFVAVERVPFVRERDDPGDGRALIVEYEDVLRSSRAGARAPTEPDDVVVRAERGEVLRRLRQAGWRLLGLSWQPTVGSAEHTPEQIDAVFRRTHELLGVELETGVCPHVAGPPRCWCRKPLPGLVVAFLHRHALSAARCVYVGRQPLDRTLARRMQLAYVDHETFFAEPERHLDLGRECDEADRIYGA